MNYFRSSLTSHELTELRTAQPSITLSLISMPLHPLSVDTMRQLGQLRGRLDVALKRGYIPGGLKDAIEQDADFGELMGRDPIDEEAFDYEDKRTLADSALLDTLQHVKKIFQGTIFCTQFKRDAGAWRYSVVWPLLELSVKLYGKDRWRPECVRSQSINHDYLSHVPNPSTPRWDRAITRKTDFCFSYSYFDPSPRTLYDRHYRALFNGCDPLRVSHTMDNFTSRCFLFSGIEVKAENGDQEEAELQLGIWMAASVRKKMELASASSCTVGHDSNETQNPDVNADEASIKALVEPASGSTVGHDSNETQNPDVNADEASIKALIEPGVAIIGHEHKIYYAYPSSATGDMAILGPDDKFTDLSTASVQGIFKLLRLYGTILDYGHEVEMDSGKKPF